MALFLLTYSPGHLEGANSSNAAFLPLPGQHDLSLPTVEEAKISTIYKQIYFTLEITSHSLTSLNLLHTQVSK